MKKLTFRDLLEGTTVTESKVLKYFKLVKRELRAKDFEVSELQKNRTWTVTFKDVRKINSDLTLLFKSNNATKIGASGLIGWNNYMYKDDRYLVPPSGVNSIKLVIDNLTRFKYGNGVIKTAGALASKANIKSLHLETFDNISDEIPDINDDKKITTSQLRDMILNNEDITKIDYSHITDMSYMFDNCKSLKTIPLLNTSNVTNMENMFSSCESLKTIPLLNTSNVTNMSGMFSGCGILKELPKLDMSKVTNAENMIVYCPDLNTPRWLLDKLDTIQKPKYL